MINVNWNRQGYQAIEAARSLLEDGEPGDNPEYERALVVRLYSGTMEHDGDEVRAAIQAARGEA